MISIQFRSEALEPDAFQILEFDGEEEISKLFRFELHLVSRDPDIDFQAVLESSAVLEITTQENTRYVHGMLCEFEQGGEWHSGLNEYRAVMVPRLWMLTQSQQNQIFQDQTVAEIIENELVELSNKGGHPLVESGLGVADYEIYTNRDYGEREYVVQYKETDFNFISRLMEHEGIFYFFENDDEREKVVITDAMDTDGVSEQCTAEFNKDAAAALYDRSVVYKLSRKQKQIPGTVLMKDYNYRSPDLPMQSEGDVTLEGIEGIGFVTEFGAHFKSPEEGEELAAIRAEEYRCQQNIYTGEGNNASFFCGGLFSLEQHFRTDYNQDYLLTRLVHHGKQDIESWGNVGGTSYYNQFSCIPSGLQYRPQRLTPKPRMYGIMNGIIDSEQDMGRADIDEEGRYKVLMPFDISGVGPGKASRRIRMSQPYGGGGTGMSFPLIKGTEVIWTCIDGDIDRPIITGTVPNPLNPSVTNTENNTSNVIKTTSGILMSFNDGAGGGAKAQSSSGDSLAAQQQNQTTEGINISSPLSRDKTTQELSLQQQESLALNANWQVGEDIYEDDTNYQVMVPHGSKKAYLRMGANCSDETITNKDDTSVDVSADSGWVDYTDGDRLSVTQGQKTEIINGGDYDLIINNGDLETANAGHMHSSEFRKVGQWGDSAMPVWRKTVLDHTCSDSYSFGDAESFFGGFTFDGFAGLATEVKVGGSLSLGVAADVEAHMGSKVSISKGCDISYSSGPVDSEGPTNEMTGYASAKVNIKLPTSEAFKGGAVIGVSTLAGVVTGAIAAGSQHKEAGSVVGGLGMGVAASLTTALTAGAIADKARKGTEAPLAELAMNPTGIRLGMGPDLHGVPSAEAELRLSKFGTMTMGFAASFIEITPKGIRIVTPKLDVQSPGMISIDGSTLIMSGKGNAQLTSEATLGLGGTKVDMLGKAGSTLG